MMRLCALAGFLGFAAAQAATSAASTVPLKPCRLEHPARMLALTAECGALRVPENPDKPGGRSIELFVARVPAISLNKKPDPLFLIAGGPGTSAVDLYTSSAGPFERVRRDRDIILVDQRGTGRSHRLDCDYGDDNVFERIDEIKVGAINIECRDELSKKVRSAHVHHQRRGARSRQGAASAGIRAHQSLWQLVRHARGAALRAPLSRSPRAP